MLLNILNTNLYALTNIISEKAILVSLIIIITIFSVLLLLGLRKSRILKKENERIFNLSKKIAQKKDLKKYKDLSNNHIYK